MRRGGRCSGKEVAQARFNGVVVQYCDSTGPIYQGDQKDMNAYRRHSGLHRLIIVLLLIPMVLSAHAGAAQTPVGETSSPAAEDVDTFDFDLSGETIQISGPQADPLGMTTFKIMDYLEEWGADVEDVTVTTTAGVQALAAGQVDVAAQGADELILGAAEGLDVVAIASQRSRMDYILVTSSDITSIEDLRGKTIGISGPNGFDALLTRMTLIENGMSTDDVNFVQIGGSGDRAAALLAGRIDAATIFISHWFEIDSQSDDFNDLLYMSELVPDFTKDVMITTQDYLEENEQVGVALACANLEANEWFHEDKEQWIEYTMDKVEAIDREVLSDLYDTLVEIDMYPQDPEEILTVEGLQSLADAMLENEDISQSVDAASLINLSYLQQAMDMGCGMSADT